jgi:hypothetical protein
VAARATGWDGAGCGATALGCETTGSGGRLAHPAASSNSSAAAYLIN